MQGLGAYDSAADEAPWSLSARCPACRPFPACCRRPHRLPVLLHAVSLQCWWRAPARPCQLRLEHRCQPRGCFAAAAAAQPWALFTGPALALFVQLRLLSFASRSSFLYEKIQFSHLISAFLVVIRANLYSLLGVTFGKKCGCASVCTNPSACAGRPFGPGLPGSRCEPSRLTALLAGTSASPALLCARHRVSCRPAARGGVRAPAAVVWPEIGCLVARQTRWDISPMKGGGIKTLV